MIIKTLNTTRSETVGFITLETAVILAWVYDGTNGRHHGTELEFTHDTPLNEIQAAVWDRYAEQQRVYKKLDAQWMEHHG